MRVRVVCESSYVYFQTVMDILDNQTIQDTKDIRTIQDILDIQDSQHNSYVRFVSVHSCVSVCVCVCVCVRVYVCVCMYVPYVPAKHLLEVPVLALTQLCRQIVEASIPFNAFGNMAEAMELRQLKIVHTGASESLDHCCGDLVGTDVEGFDVFTRKSITSAKCIPFHDSMYGRVKVSRIRDVTQSQLQEQYGKPANERGSYMSGEVSNLSFLSFLSPGYPL